MARGRVPGSTSVVALALALAACGVGIDPAVPSSAEPPTPVSVLEGARFEGYRSGSAAIEVTAARARIEGDEVAHLDHVRIEFQTGDRGSVEVRAERGRLDLDSLDFVLLGDVSGSTGVGERFTTAELHYDEASRRLWTERPVRVQRGKLATEGDGLRLDLDSHRLHILGRVRATLGAP